MKGDDRREQILESAIKAFSAHGYEKTSIASICEPIGIARGTLYQYFDNKRALFNELVRIYTQRIRASMDEFDFEGAAPESFDLVRYRRLVSFFEEVYNHREIYGVIMREGLTRSQETGGLVLKLHWNMIDLIAEEYQAASKVGFVSVADPEFTATSIYGILLMAMQRYVVYTDEPVEPKVLARKVAEFLVSSQKL